MHEVTGLFRYLGNPILIVYEDHFSGKAKVEYLDAHNYLAVAGQLLRLKDDLTVVKTDNTWAKYPYQGTPDEWTHIMTRCIVHVDVRVDGQWYCAYSALDHLDNLLQLPSLQQWIVKTCETSTVREAT